MYRPWRLPFNSSGRCAAGAAIADVASDQPFRENGGRHDGEDGERDRRPDVARQCLAGEEGGVNDVAAERAEREDQRDQHRDPGPARPHAPSQTIIMTGFAISCLNAPISSAPSAPSMARWSQDSVTLIICAISILPPRTTGRSSLVPTARIVACGGLITAVKGLMPDMPRLATAGG